MSTVRLIGWKSEFKKVSHTKIIRKYTGYGLAEGKRCTDDVLDGKEVVISNLTEEAARKLLEEVTEIGVVAAIEIDSLPVPPLRDPGNK